MEIRYKAQVVFLTSTDKSKIQGYWVPCIQAREEEQINEMANDDDLSNAKRPNHYPTMIFCNPNAGFAEYF